MKKLICVALFLLLLLTGVSAMADVGDGWGSYGDNIEWTFTARTGTLELVGTGDIAYAGSRRDYPWFSYEGQITKIVFSEGIVSIPDEIFNGSSYDYQNLTTVQLPSTLKTIGASAFGWCHNLTVVNFPEGLTDVGYMSFCDTALVSIKIPGSVKEIADYAFSNINSSDNVELVLSEGIQSIGKSAFLDSNIVLYDFPSSLTKIGDSAFAGCKNVRITSIPARIVSLGDKAFSSCNGIRYIDINASIDELPGGLFSHCESLEVVSIRGTITRMDGYESFGGRTPVKAFYIPAQVTSIGEYTLAYIPQNITLYGYKKTAAYNYAGMHAGVDFVDLSTPEGAALWNSVSTGWKIDPPKNELALDDDGIWRVYLNGQVNTDANGYVEYDGNRFFVANGVLQTGANGVVQDPADPATWYFCAEGRVVGEHTGLAEYDGQWFFVRNGKLDTGLNAFVDYNGATFLIAAGRLVSEYSGLVQDPNGAEWYYVAEGRVVNEYSGLALYDGTWFYIKWGRFDTSAEGWVEYNGQSYYVVNGVLAQ